MTTTVEAVWHHPVTLNTLVPSNSALERTSPSELNSAPHLMEWLSEVQRRYYITCESVNDCDGKRFIQWKT